VTYSGFHHQFLLHRSFEEFESRSLATAARQPNTIEDEIKRQKGQHIVLIDLRILEVLGERRWTATAGSLEWANFYPQFLRSKAGLEWAKSKLEWDEKGFGAFVVNAADLVVGNVDSSARNPLSKDLLSRVWFVFTEPQARAAPSVRVYPLFTDLFQDAGGADSLKWFARFTGPMAGKIVFSKPFSFYSTPTGTPLPLVDHTPFGKISVESDFILMSTSLPGRPSFGMTSSAEVGPDGSSQVLCRLSGGNPEFETRSVPCDFPF
jgi:hypothetical protein